MVVLPLRSAIFCSTPAEEKVNTWSGRRRNVNVPSALRVRVAITRGAAAMLPSAVRVNEAVLLFSCRTKTSDASARPVPVAPGATSSAIA